MFKQYDAYQDSNNLELPIVPVGWKVDRIKYEIKLLTGYPFNSSKYTEEGIKLVRGINVKESVLDWKDTAYWPEVTPDLQRYLLKDGDLLIGMDGSKVGKNFCQVSEQDLPLLLLQRVARLRVKNLLNARYLYWNLASKRFLNWINRSKTDPMIPHMAPKDINDFVIAYPSTEEQSRIALFLDQKTSEIDQAIAIKEQQISLLNERKQIVIQKAVTQGLDPNVPMKDSGVEWIGQIPEHWECKPSRYAFRAVKRFKRDGTEIKFSVTQKWGVIPTDEMQESATQAVSFDGFQICLEDDLVLNKYKAHLGVFWRAPSRGLITGNYTVFEPLKGINSKYFELLYHTPVYIDIFRTIVYGVIEGMMPLYNNDFYDMLSIVPPLEEQLAIVQYVEEQQKEFSKIERVFLGQIEKLKEYKTTLINDAVTGKIKVA